MIFCLCIPESVFLEISKLMAPLNAESFLKLNNEKSVSDEVSSGSQQFTNTTTVVCYVADRRLRDVISHPVNLKT